MSSNPTSLNLPAARQALRISFLATSLLGALWISLYWTRAGSPALAATRVPVFILCMAALHALGHRLYREQGGLARRIGSRIRACRSELTAALAFQVALVFFGSLLLDTGTILRMVLLASAGHWAGILAILTRRAPLSQEDRQFIRLGLLILLATIPLLCVLLRRAL